MPQGQELVWWIVILFCLGFMCWWPYRELRKLTAAPSEEECPRCGRTVEFIDMHVRYCKGQLARRNPLSQSIATKTFKKGENKDELEDLFP